MSDRERVLDALRAAGPHGVTTLYIRSTGLSGNPSQRRAELEELGHVIRAEPEKIGERWYKRYFLDVEVGGGPGGPVNPVASHTADLNAEALKLFESAA